MNQLRQSVPALKQLFSKIFTKTIDVQIMTSLFEISYHACIICKDLSVIQIISISVIDVD